MVEAGVDPEALLDTYIGLLNECVRDRPAGMIAGIHICRGNVKVRARAQALTPRAVAHDSNGPLTGVRASSVPQPDGSRFTRGPYDCIARKVLTALKVDCFYVRILVVLKMVLWSNSGLITGAARV